MPPAAPPSTRLPPAATVGGSKHHFRLPADGHLNAELDGHVVWEPCVQRRARLRQRESNTWSNRHEMTLNAGITWLCEVERQGVYAAVSTSRVHP